MWLEEIFAAAGLLICTIAASAAYYRMIRKAQQQIDASVGTVNHLMASFSRQLGRITRQVDGLQGETTMPKDDSDAREFRDVVKSSIDGIASKTRVLEADVSSLRASVEQIAKSRQAASRGFVGKRRPELDPDQSQSKEELEPGEASLLGELNATELSVLDLLDREGELSGPSIRDALGRTREHTARLLKKLYDAGFIDRSIGQMPYRYKIRKELTDILRSQQKKMDLTP